MRLICSAVLLAAISLGILQSATAQTAQEAVVGETPGFLLVLSARSVSAKDGTLTLVGSPAATYFSDRPARTAGHMTLQRFVDQWDTYGYEDDPPNAALATLGDSQVVTVVELLDVELDGDALRFGFRALEGDGPTGELGPASLFIDTVRPFKLSSIGVVKN